ncbi:MAG: NADH/ubiquinone/plastoquinone (complex I) [Candidatus Cloacimonetes bacterium]|nr:NADH/ubiquinone/plastoquinone (complex I) [Candidatus Cloacimonadota bacterium]
MNSLVPLFVIIPLGSAFLMAIFGRIIKGFNKVLLPLALLFLTYLSIKFLLGAEGTITYQVGGFAPVAGVPIAIYLAVDGLSRLMLTIISLIGFLACFYSISYINIYTAERKYLILFSLMIAGMNGIVISGDIFNIFVFLEIASIASYALVAFGIDRQELEASFKYQVLGGVASLLILFSIGFLYWRTGTLNIADISTQLPYGGIFVKFIAMVFLVGFGLKAAIFPFHSWLPDAHSSAPSPISAMLSGVLIKAVGLYVIFRLFFNMFALSHQIAMIITVLGTLSMVIGGLLAIGQWDIKRLLAYSSISQVGYIILGVGIGMLILSRQGNTAVASLAIIGGIFHLLNHSVFKSLLFLSAGAVEFRTGERNMKKLGGLAEVLPVTSSTSMIASLSISGLPPFNGFFSKLLIIIAAVQAGYYLLALLAVIISIVTIGYFMKMQKFTFFNRSRVFWQDRNIREVPFVMCFSMIILALLCFALSLLMIPSLRDVVLTPAVNVLVEGLKYTNAVLGY